MEYTNIIGIILLLMVAVIYRTYKKTFSYWAQRGVYAPPLVFPFGNAKNFLLQKWPLGLEFLKVYEHLKKKSLSFGGYYFLFKPIFVPVDLDIVKRILITDFEHFTDHSLGLQEFDPIGGHLFALQGSQWKATRAKLSPAFTATKNKMLFGTVLKYTDDLLEILDEASNGNHKVDVYNLTSRFAMDIISSCAFGFDCDSLKNPNSEIRSTTLKFLEPSVRNSIVFGLAWMCPSILEVFKIRMIKDEVAQFFIKLMEETVDYRETNGVTRPDFVQLMLQIRNSSDQSHGQNVPGLTIADMAAHSVIFYFAGYEANGLSITFCLYELAKNAEIQEKARQEVKTKLLEQEHEEGLSHNFIQSLSYLEQVIYETLRKYPLLPFLTRSCTKDYAIPNTNVKIEKGSVVFIPTLGIHRDHDIYPNPEEFDPDRFSPEVSESRPSWAHLPFGSGPRTCIAYQFGLMQIKVAVASLLRRYKFTINSETEQPLQVSKSAVLLMPANTVWLNFERL